MTVEELKRKHLRRKAMMGDYETLVARNKLFLGQALTAEESRKIFEYLRKLEKSIDMFLDM